MHRAGRLLVVFVGLMVMPSECFRCLVYFATKEKRCAIITGLVPGGLLTLGR